MDHSLTRSRSSIKTLFVLICRTKFRLDLWVRITEQFANSTTRIVKGIDLYGRLFRYCAQRSKKGQLQVCQISLNSKTRSNIASVTQAVQTPQANESNALFTVPFARDSQFLGREDIMITINSKFEIERRVALTGIGGVG